jgi:O-antigen ligase
LLLAPALSVVITSLDRRYKMLAIVAFGLGAAGLLLTASRGGWLGFALSIALLCVAALQRGWLSPRVILTMAIAAAVLSLLFGTTVLARLTGDDAGAAASRIPLAQIALRIIRDHPLLGVGVNNYTTVLETYITAEHLDVYRFTVHNKYLLVWAETGLIGLVTFLGFLFALILRGWKVWMRRDRLLSPLALGFAVAVVGQMAHMFFDIFHGRPQLQMLWIVAGLVTAMYFMDRSAG